MMRTSVALIVMAAVAWAGSESKDIAHTLDTVMLSVDFKETTVAEAVEFLRQATRLNYVVQDGEGRRVRLTLRDVSARTVLKLMLGPLELSAEARNGAVVIVSREKVTRRLECRVYDVRSGLVRIRDFPGPGVELASGHRGTYLLGAG